MVSQGTDNKNWAAGEGERRVDYTERGVRLNLEHGPAPLYLGPQGGTASRPGLGTGRGLAPEGSMNVLRGASRG